SIGEANEELRIGRVRVLGAGHRARASDVADRRELSLEVGLLGTAHAGAARVEALAALLAELHVTGLRHEIVDDAMEDNVVIGLLTSEFLDAGDMFRRYFRQQLDDNLTLGGFQDDGVFGILDLGHSSFLICLETYLLPPVTLIIRSGLLTSPFWPSPRLILST